MIPINRGEVKSDEEWNVVMWLQEAKGFGLVQGWEYEPRDFVLSDKQTYTRITQLKTKERRDKLLLHQEKKYTPDFCIVFTEKGMLLWKLAFPQSYWIAIEDGGAERMAYIDVKGTYNPYQNDDQLFDMKRFIMHDIYGYWTTKVIPFYHTGKKGARKPAGLFFRTYAPDSLRHRADGKGLRSMGKACPSIKSFIQNNDGFLFDHGLALGLRNRNGRA